MNEGCACLGVGASLMTGAIWSHIQPPSTPKGHAPVEQQHITHKVPAAGAGAQFSSGLRLTNGMAPVFCLALVGALVANDILNHPNFVKKNP